MRAGVIWGWRGLVFGVSTGAEMENFRGEAGMGHQGDYRRFGRRVERWLGRGLRGEVGRTAG